MIGSTSVVLKHQFHLFARMLPEARALPQAHIAVKLTQPVGPDDKPTLFEEKDIVVFFLRKRRGVGEAVSPEPASFLSSLPAKSRFFLATASRFQGQSSGAPEGAFHLWLSTSLTPGWLKLHAKS